MLHAAAAARATLLQASFLNVKLGLGIRNTQGSQHYRGSKSIIKLTSGFGDRKCKILEVQKQDTNRIALSLVNVSGFGVSNDRKCNIHRGSKTG